MKKIQLTADVKILGAVIKTDSILTIKTEYPTFVTTQEYPNFSIPKNKYIGICKTAITILPKKS